MADDERVCHLNPETRHKHNRDQSFPEFAILQKD